jgi:hypothetical protein
MNRSPLSSLASEARWRRPVAKSFYVSGFVAPVASCSGSVVTATVGTVTAVRPVVRKPIGKNDARPTAVTSKVPRGDSIIETVSGRFVGAVWPRQKV